MAPQRRRIGGLRRLVLEHLPLRPHDKAQQQAVSFLTRAVRICLQVRSQVRNVVDRDLASPYPPDALDVLGDRYRADALRNLCRGVGAFVQQSAATLVQRDPTALLFGGGIPSGPKCWI